MHRDDVISGIAINGVGAAVARDGIVTATTANHTRGGAVVVDDVDAVPTVHQHDVRTVGLDVIVTRTATNGHRADAMDDDDIVARTAINGHRNLHAGIDKDVVVAGAGVDEQVGYVLVGVVAAITGDFDGPLARIARDLVKGQRLIRLRTTARI